MNSLHLAQGLHTSSKIHIAKFILYSLTSIVGLVSIISIEGCTDKAAEIRDQECANMQTLIDKKVRAPNTNGYEGAVETEKEVNKLYDEYHIKCDKKK